MEVRVAYLISRYPAISHSFILREVLGLRRRGFEIHTASINPPDRPEEKLTSQERLEANGTFCIKSAGVGRILAAHLRLFAASPLRFAAGLAYAVRLAGADVHTLLYHLFYLVEAVILADWMRRRHLRHVHVHFATPAATVALIACRVCKLQFSMTVHGPDEFYAVRHYLLAEKIRQARFVCCISQYCRSQLMMLSAPSQWHKFELSPLGVDPDIFTPVAREATGTLRILCVGRLVAAKGQSVLLQALAQLVRGESSVSLTLVGDGPDRPALEHLASELGIGSVVHFAGAVNQDSIRLMYQRADVFVLPSFAEGVPVVLMEAMAMSVPCISTAITGIPELITSGSSGLLVPPSDSDMLAEAISLLSSTPSLAERLGTHGREKVLRDYNLQLNIDRLANILTRRLTAARVVPESREVIA